jgi:hypothetical protein
MENQSMKTAIAKQREAWLNRATVILRKKWAKLDVAVPADVQLSCGFPGGGSPRRRIGECWPRSRSAHKVNQIFVSPVLGDAMTALDVLGHELLHAVDDCASMHGHVFSKNSRRVGYSGGKRSAAESPSTLKLLASINKRLGAYPHGAVVLTTKKTKASNGLHKYECPAHGDVLYSTAKQAEDRGAPTCRECGKAMTLHDRTKKKVITTV